MNSVYSASRPLNWYRDSAYPAIEPRPTATTVAITAITALLPRNVQNALEPRTEA